MVPAPSSPTLELAAADRAAIDALTATFFAAFDNRGGRAPAADELRGLFVPGAIITRRAGERVDHHGVDDFLAPRLELLTGGRLRDFEEWEVWSRTDGFAGIAQRVCVYEKRGVLDGAPFHGRGVKLLQLVRADLVWRLAALTWQDVEPPPAG